MRESEVTNILGKRIKDIIERRKISYDKFNVPVSITDVNGVQIKYSYNNAGLVSRIERTSENEIYSSLSVVYDGAGRPASYTDQDGLTKSFERDAFGKVLKEKFPDGSECAYSYDALGRRTSVIDENGHEIRFGWGSFGLKSRTTAIGQLTDYVRDDLGLVKEVITTWGGKEDRRISSEYDNYGRLVCADYGNGEIERFEYDKWNRLSKHTRGKTEETYKYDHFGRLVEKKETLSSSPSTFTFFLPSLPTSFNVQMNMMPRRHPTAPNAMNTLRQEPRKPSSHATASPDTISPTYKAA